MFLSLRMHARHWSNPLGRHFFQDQTKTTDRTSDPDAPNQRPATRHHRCGGHRRDRRARAAVPVGGGAWPSFETTHQTRQQRPSPTSVEGAGGTGGPGCGARGRWRGLAAVPVGGGGAWPGFETTRSATHQRPSPTGVEGAGGTGGPGCGARGRWRGLAGLRDDAPSEARSADGSRAGRRPRAHQAARPNKAHATPGTPVGPQATPPKRKAYSPRNALIAGISRTACTRPAR